MLRAARLAEAGGRASGARAFAASGAFSATAAACETRGGVRPRADAGARRWVSGDAARGGESASEAATRPAYSSSASSSSASPEALVRAGRPLEFSQAAELVFAAHRAGRLGWDWHAWHFLVALAPAAGVAAWVERLKTSGEAEALLRMGDGAPPRNVNGGGGGGRSGGDERANDSEKDSAKRANLSAAATSPEPQSTFAS